MANNQHRIRIGTRRSQLAMWQACYVRDRLLAIHPGLDIEIVEIVSEGDKTLDIPLSSVGGKGLFLKELEMALLNGDTDIAVHSMKDVTVTLPEGLVIPVICPREDPRDAFVSNRYQNIEDMPAGSVVGSCSLRRRCQIQAAFPHLEVRNLRGNVNTRLARLDAGDYDALILATAGLIRLEFQERIQQYLPVEICLPAVGQGAVGIECRADDEKTQHLIAPLNDKDATIRLRAERAANKKLGGGCHVPIAVYAELKGGTIKVTGLVGEPDGTRVLHASASGGAENAASLGVEVAEALMAQGAADTLERIYQQDRVT